MGEKMFELVEHTWEKEDEGKRNEEDKWSQTSISRGSTVYINLAMDQIII